MGQIYLASQLDVLHLSLINVIDMVKDGEIDLLLDQAGKSPKQKALFLQKIVDGVESTELRQALQETLNEQAGTAMQSAVEDSFSFFREHALADLLHRLQSNAESITIVRLQVATEFKPDDLREMATLLSKKINQQVALLPTVEHSLIGGAIVQFGTYLSDYSVRARLEQFRAHWHRAVIER